MKNKKRKRLKGLAAALLVAALITGCGNAQGSNTQEAEEVAASTQTASDSDPSVQTSASVSAESQVEVDKEFTARDLDIGYEESTAVLIALKGESAEVSGDGAKAEGNIVTISDEGTYVLSGTLMDGQIVVDAEDTDKVQLVLDGVTLSSADNAPIYIKNADKIFITLAEGSENTLTDSAERIQSDDNNVDAVIFSKADLTVNGSGVLNITGNYKHGIVSKDDLIITGGTLNITALKDALNGKDCVKIKDGTFNLTVTDGNGIQSKNGDDATKGYVYICGGEINVLNGQEGIEGTALVIDGGMIDIRVQDDGLNAASGNSSAETEKSGGFGRGGEMGNDTNCYIAINGGTITIDAGGDGIDSNGSIYVTGGTAHISGPEDDGNAGLDYNGSAQITGGTFVVTGSSGMAQGFSDSSTQYSLLNNLTSAASAGTEAVLTDADGNVIISVTPQKQYQSVLISTPDLLKDGTYTLTCGEQTAEITLSGIATSNGQLSGFGGGGEKMNWEGKGPDGSQMPQGSERPDGSQVPQGSERPDDGQIPQGSERTDDGQMPPDGQTPPGGEIGPAL
ncbi:uncharacterized protein DUF4353 [Kineothrix alysoides]|uniref:Uncharacterized protein DUF4353 n=2 Tax=Kineothrix alysoides TaxID=1469948 RepID=A0A4R1QR34_9FIRM|nr:uncharacterized protein DUF4353 [Kineothrix alysoides]